MLQYTNNYLISKKVATKENKDIFRHAKEEKSIILT